MIALVLLLAQAPVPNPVPVPPSAIPSARPEADRNESPSRSGTPAATAADAGTAEAGGAAAIYEKRCTFCHAADGSGSTKKGRQLKAPDFRGDRWQRHTTDAEIVSAITDGIPKHRMPAFKDKLTSEEIASLVPFLRAFAQRK